MGTAVRRRRIVRRVGQFEWDALKLDEHRFQLGNEGHISVRREANDEAGKVDVNRNAPRPIRDNLQGAKATFKALKVFGYLASIPSSRASRISMSDRPVTRA